MENIEVGKTKIVVYDDIEEMPIRVFQRFNEHLIQDSGIGSKISDVDQHFRRLDQFLMQKDFENALQERKNLHQAVWNAFMYLDHSSLAFAAIIYTVDGEEVTHKDIDSAQKLLDDLSDKGLTYQHVQEVTDAIKKKYLTNYLGISQVYMEEVAEWNILQSLRN
jgi:hypothetical protein